MYHNDVLQGLQGHDRVSAARGLESGAMAPPRRQRRSSAAYVWGETCNEDDCADADLMLPDYWSAEDQEQMRRMAASRASSSSSRTSCTSGYPPEEFSLGDSFLRLVGTVGSYVLVPLGKDYWIDIAEALTSDAGGECSKGTGSAASPHGGAGSTQGAHSLGAGINAVAGLKKSQ
ncbi:hypothetical protein TSOC_006373 [Tetrabaena socialis]|uniref:Uncharacterized protein n=1 Tax=Tetrabaena socialis TaxID=47790 RepID=A0A2J8A3X0_9CHLO|nr:hypothetical protein TSOC_006373 [Tetrabaena socialis]|eukprot:PNH07198.1 hypothetical protein TSOC_006373 [Tetrabaena socialis]